MVIIKADIKRGKVGLVLGFYISNLLFRRVTKLLRFQHDRRTVRIVRTHVSAIHTAQFLEAHPNIGLDIFHQMAEVNRTIGVRQGAGNQDLAGLLSHGLKPVKAGVYGR